MNNETHAVLAALKQEGGSLTRLDMTRVRDDIDEMLILKVTNQRALRNAVRSITQALREEHYDYRIDQDRNWTAIAVNGAIVHVFTPETARFYRLEQLWGMCPAAQIA